MCWQSSGGITNPWVFPAEIPAHPASHGTQGWGCWGGDSPKEAENGPGWAERAGGGCSSPAGEPAKLSARDFDGSLDLRSFSRIFCIFLFLLSTTPPFPFYFFVSFSVHFLLFPSFSFLLSFSLSPSLSLFICLFLASFLPLCISLSPFSLFPFPFYLQDDVVPQALPRTKHRCHQDKVPVLPLQRRARSEHLGALWGAPTSSSKPKILHGSGCSGTRRGHWHLSHCPAALELPLGPRNLALPKAGSPQTKLPVQGPLGSQNHRKCKWPLQSLSQVSCALIQF